MKNNYLLLALLPLFLLASCGGAFDKKPDAPEVSSISVIPGIGNYPGDVLMFQANIKYSSNPGQYTYEWDFGDGGTSVLKEPAHSFASSGQYPVTVIVSNETGSDSKTTVVTINEEEGDIYFWTNTQQYGYIYVQLNGTSKTVTSYYLQFPGCGINQGFAEYIDLPWGTYTYTASAQFGGKTWSGSVTIDDNCTKVLLD
ncbi:MAG: PKD domain-containing protein [Flavobacteriales bacterium]